MSKTYRFPQNVTDCGVKYEFSGENFQLYVESKVNCSPHLYLNERTRQPVQQCVSLVCLRTTMEVCGRGTGIIGIYTDNTLLVSRINSVLVLVFDRVSWQLEVYRGVLG